MQDAVEKGFRRVVKPDEKCYNVGKRKGAAGGAEEDEPMKCRGMQVWTAMGRKWICALLTIALLAVAGTALADETVRIDHAALTTDGEWVEAAIKAQEYHYFPLELAEVGKLTVRVQTTVSGLPFQFLDADLRPWQDLYLYGCTGAPDTGDFVFYLEPGSYYVRYNGDSVHAGDFRVKAIFSPLACDEIRENGEEYSAMPLTDGAAVSGVLTEGNDGDVYSFVLDAERELRLVCNSEVEEQQMLTVYDGDMVEMYTQYDLHGFVREEKLEAGTYYLRLHGAKGPYTLRYEAGK